MLGPDDGKDGHCAYVVFFSFKDEEVRRCGKQTVLYERYCEEHIKHVHKRTNIFDDVMPDDSRAPWKEKA